MILARFMAYLMLVSIPVTLIISYMLPVYAQPRSCNEKITGASDIL